MWAVEKKTTIILIRHGETDWNLAGRWQGNTDIPLNDTGRQQARMLARRLKANRWPIDAIYSSDLLRAAETAQIAAEKLHLPVQLDAQWRERGLGILEGLTRREISEKYPYMVLPRTFIEAPESESYASLKRRVVLALEEILRQHDGETVAVVSHSGTLRVLISYILELPEKIYAPFSLRGNTGLSRIIIDGELAQLNLLNDTSHIEWLGSID